MNKKVRYSGWQGDKVIRFFNKNHCKYEDKHVHSEIITNYKVGYLNGQLEHYTYQSLTHFSNKIERYANWSAKDYSKKTKHITYYHLWIKPLFRFFNHFFIKSGFMDGKVGFIISSYMAWGVFLRYSKLKELRLKQKWRSKADNRNRLRVAVFFGSFFNIEVCYSP